MGTQIGDTYGSALQADIASAIAEAMSASQRRQQEAAGAFTRTPAGGSSSVTTDARGGDK